jgi:predicted O-methyltransferase YrrM
MTSTLELVRDVRERLLATGAIEDRADGRVHELFPVAVGPKEGSALREWVRREGAAETLEVGLGYGTATLFICEALLENGLPTRHVAIDPYQRVARPGDRTRYAGVGLAVLQSIGLRDLVEFHEEESQLVLPRLLADGRQFDFAYVDGGNRFDAVFLDLVYCARLVRPGSIVFVDDVHHATVRKAIDYCAANLGWNLEDEGVEGPDHAWQVLRTAPSDAFRRSYTEFVDF